MINAKIWVKGGANYTEQDAIKQLAKTIGGFDVITDSACGDGMNLLIATLKPGGKFVFMVLQEACQKS